MQIGHYGLALIVCLVVFDLKVHACLVGEVVFSLGQLLMMRRHSVDLMIACCCLVFVDDDLILCFLISIVCCGARTRDIISRIF